MTELISIIIPIYNGEKYIDRCLKKIEEQSYKYYEVIIIDDGSKDNTKNICSYYLKRNDKIHYFYKENSGVSDSRNLGIDKAKGKWITFIDCDDYISKKYLSELVNKIKKDTDFVCSNYYNVKGTEISECPIKINDNLTKDNFIDMILNDKYVAKNKELLYKASRNVWGKLYKKDILIKNNIRFKKNIKLFEDGIFQLEYLKYVNKIDITSESIYYYLLNEGSATHKYQKDRIIEDKEKIKFLNDYLNGKNIETFNLFKFDTLCSYFKSTLFNKENKQNFIEKYLTLKKIIKNNEYEISSINIYKYLSLSKKFMMFLYNCKLALFISILMQIRECK